MAGTSSKTKVVAMRVPIETLEVLENQAETLGTTVAAIGVELLSAYADGLRLPERAKRPKPVQRETTDA